VCTLHDLCPEDKQKVAKLLKQVSKLLYSLTHTSHTHTHTHTHTHIHTKHAHTHTYAHTNTQVVELGQENKALKEAQDIRGKRHVSESEQGMIIEEITNLTLNTDTYTCLAAVSIRRFQLYNLQTNVYVTSRETEMSEKQHGRWCGCVERVFEGV